MEETVKKDEGIVTDNSIRLIKGDKEIFIVGTAHVSEESRKEVESLIDSVNPDTVCIELCDSRYQSLKNKEKWKNLDIVKVIREGKGFLLFANMILSAFQKRIGADLKSAPGEEMITAAAIAEAKNKNIVLADRDVNVTLKRAWRLSSLGDKIKIFEVLLETLFVNEKIEKEDIDELMKGEDVFNQIMGIFAEKLPKVKQVFIDERDMFLSQKIINAPGNKIVAVVGKGHVKGIENYIKKDFTYDISIETVPPAGITSKMIPWIIFGIIIVVIVWGFMKGSSIGLSMLWAWVIASGTCTAIFAAIVLAHPLTILAAWVAAPIKLIIPTTSAGILLAPLEAFLRKPRVRDFESLNEDILTFKGFMKNRVTKILTVFVSVTIGAIIGHTIAIIWITKILATR